MIKLPKVIFHYLSIYVDVDPWSLAAKNTRNFSVFHLGTILTMQANCNINRLEVSVTFVFQGEKKSKSQTSMYIFFFVFVPKMDARPGLNNESLFNV